MLTCTLAPASTQLWSLTAKKMFPASLIRFSVSRLAPPLIALRSQQSSSLAFSLFNESAGLLEPVAAKVRFRAHAIPEGAKQGFHVAVAQFAAKQLAA